MKTGRGAWERREFLQWCASGLVASRIPHPASREKLSAIGVQLYTVRSEMAKDFEGTLARVAAAGYQEVEFAGYYDRSAKDVRAVLDRHGLRAPSAHVSKEDLERNGERVLADAATIGHRYICIAWIAQEERRTLDDVKRVAAAFNRIGERCGAAGMQFAYHNHDFEFATLEGKVLYDVLLEETDPALVQLEVDLYWITKGGHDPLAYFTRYPGRVPLVHVKDSAGPPDHRMVDVGGGTIDFKRIFARRQAAGIRHFFVEHDQPRDPLASIKASYEYLKRLEF